MMDRKNVIRKKVVNRSREESDFGARKFSMKI